MCDRDYRKSEKRKIAESFHATKVDGPAAAVGTTT